MNKFKLLCLIITAFVLMLSSQSCKKEKKVDDTTVKPDPVTITDIDGNAYKTVRIGTQLWMAENLKTTRYTNGDPIPTTEPFNQSVHGETSPMYQWITNYDPDLLMDFGRAYTWDVANHAFKKLCPQGWRIPSVEDWQTLMVHCGARSDQTGGSQGGKLMVRDTKYWNPPLSAFADNITNETGFGAYGGGERGSNGVWGGFKQNAEFMTSSKKTYFPLIRLSHTDGSWHLTGSAPNFGIHVRCLMDE